MAHLIFDAFAEIESTFAAVRADAFEQGGFVGQRLTVEERYFGTGAAASLVFEDERGNVFGVIPRNQRDNWFVGEQVVVRTAKGSDGNLKAMIERVSK